MGDFFQVRGWQTFTIVALWSTNIVSQEITDKTEEETNETMMKLAAEGMKHVSKNMALKIRIKEVMDDLILDGVF